MLTSRKITMAVTVLVGALMLGGMAACSTTMGQETSTDVRGNVSDWCDQNGNRIYVWNNYHGGGIAVSPKDVSCP